MQTHGSYRPAPFRPGDDVFGIWNADGAGTVGAHGQVEVCEPHPRGGWRLVARLGEHREEYRLSPGGHSDYVGRPMNPPTTKKNENTVPSNTTTRPAWATESQRERRGHDFYPSSSQLVAVPAPYATEEVPCEEKILHLHYFAGGSDWWVAEVDQQTGQAFGFARTGGYEPGEWGYFDLPDLERVQARTAAGPMVIERDLHWTPHTLPELSSSAA